MDFNILLLLIMLSLNVDLWEAIHLANRSATPIARAVELNVSSWRGRLIFHEHAIKASFICNIQHLSNQRSVESQICKSSSWNTIYFLLKEKWSPRHKNLVCGKANEQDGATWEFESLAVTEYFLGLGYCDLYSPWGWQWQTIGEIWKVSSMYLCKKIWACQKVKCICFLHVLI